MLFIRRRISYSQSNHCNWGLYWQKHYQPIRCDQWYFSGLGEGNTSKKRGLDSWWARCRRFQSKAFQHQFWRQIWSSNCSLNYFTTTTTNMKYLFTILHISLWIGSQWHFHFSIANLWWISLKVYYSLVLTEVEELNLFHDPCEKMKSTIFGYF